MCGISGKIHLQTNMPPVQSGEIQGMVEKLQHRGPDGHGIYISPDGVCGFGHNRLAIVDLSEKGNQPMSDPDGKIWITFNGEIYNFETLRADLIAKGYNFVSHTDTEVIIAMYKEYGEECVKYLDGMFAFAIWDEHEKQLFIARDRLGKKPLKYYFDDKVFLFASELKAFLHHPDVYTSIDEQALYQYLAHGYIPHPATGFRNIYKLEAGHYMTVKNGILNKQSYWSVPPFQPQKRSFKDWKVAVRETLTQSVAKRLMGDVPVGVFLSGGIDSSTVTAIAATKSDERIRTFSLGFELDTYNELPAAKRVADMYRTEHYERILKPASITELPGILAHMDEPFADASILPHASIARVVGEQVKVVMSGNGSDEIFFGYTRYLYERYLRILSIIPRALRMGIAHFITKYEPLTRFWGINRILRKFQKFMELDPYGMRYQGCIYGFTPTQLEMSWKGLPPTESADTFFARFAHQVPNSNASEKAMWVDMHSYLVDDVLVKEDMLSMMYGVEVRNPFLDPKLIELAQTIPFNLKLKGRTQKYILKKSIADLLPKENLIKPKHGFVGPTSLWLQTDFKYFLARYILPADAFVKTLIEPEYIQRIFDEHTNRIVDRHQELWTLLALEIWYQEVGKTVFQNDNN